MLMHNLGDILILKQKRNYSGIGLEIIIESKWPEQTNYRKQRSFQNWTDTKDRCPNEKYS